MTDTIVQLCISGNGKFVPFASSFSTEIQSTVAKHILETRKSMKFKDPELNRTAREDTEALERLLKKLGLI